MLVISPLENGSLVKSNDSLWPFPNQFLVSSTAAICSTKSDQLVDKHVISTVDAVSVVELEIFQALESDTNSTKCGIPETNFLLKPRISGEERSCS